MVVMATEQRRKGVRISGDMRSEQLDIRGSALGDPPEDAHRRMLAQNAGPRAAGADYVVALNPTSAMEDWFLPPEVLRPVIQTRTLVVGASDVTGISVTPLPSTCEPMTWVWSRVGSSEGALRISTLVPGVGE